MSWILSVVYSPEIIFDLLVAEARGFNACAFKVNGLNSTIFVRQLPLACASRILFFQVVGILVERFPTLRLTVLLDRHYNTFRRSRKRDIGINLNQI